MDRIHPKVTYLFKPHIDIENEANSYFYLKNGQKQDVLLFILDKDIVLVTANEQLHKTPYKVGQPNALYSSKLNIPSPFWYVQFKETLKTMCCNHYLGLLLVLDELGQIWIVKLEEMIKSVHEEPMDLDEDIFNDQPNETSVSKKKVDIKQNLCFTVEYALDIISSDNVVYVAENNYGSINIVVYKIDKENLSARRIFNVPFSVECSISKLFLVFHEGSEPTLNTIEMKEPFYKKMLPNTSNCSLLFGLDNGGIFCMSHGSNNFELICDLGQDLIGIISIDMQKIFVKADTLFSSQKLNVQDLSCKCLSFIGKKGRCLTMCFIEQDDQILLLNNQFPRDVVCCTNKNEFLVIASEVDVTIFKATMIVKEVTASKKSLKNGDISMELQCLQIFDLSFILNLMVTSVDTVLEVIACNTFGKVMRFECNLENVDRAKPSCDMASYNKMTSDLKDLQSISNRLNHQLSSLSNIGHAFQMILRQSSLFDIKIDSKLIIEASRKKVLLEVGVHNQCSYIFKSDWSISLLYRKLFDEQHGNVNTHTETCKINCLASNEMSKFNFIFEPEYITFSPLQCDFFLEHLPTASNEEVKPFSVHLKSCVIDILQFCNTGSNNIITSTDIYRTFCPEKLLETNYTFSLNLDGSALRRFQKKIVSNKASIFPLPASSGTVKFLKYIHVNGDIAEIEISIGDNENVHLKANSNTLLFLVGIHYQLFQEFKNVLIGKSREKLTTVCENFEELLKKTATVNHQLKGFQDENIPSSLLKQVLHVYLEQRTAIFK